MKKKQRASSSRILRELLVFALSLAVVFGPLALAPSSSVAASRLPDHKDRNTGDDTWHAGDQDHHGDHDSGNQYGDHDHGSNGGCNLNSARGEIKHVIYIQFDNVHFERDNPNVPSDLELMPNLLNFMEDSGTLLTNSHTPLIAHTADDIITSLTGVYGDRHGGPIANSFGVFPAAPVPATSDASSFVATFTYWTDPVSTATPPLDSNFIMLAANGLNAPAPWVPYTRAGCNVGAVSIANMELENVGNDINNVFGPTSTEAAEASSNSTKAIADFEGIAVHCAAGNALCSSTNNGEADILPDEPSTYTGFNALYGHKFVAPLISPTGPTNPLLDLDGNVITDAHGNDGFPGFSAIDAAQTLAYVADMQEHGVPVTFAYISDIHDNPWQGTPHENPYAPAACQTDPETAALGPGDVCHYALAQAYDEAFGKFFARLKTDGITKDNTLFLITEDEQDQFAGGTPISSCDGVTIFCTYTYSTSSVSGPNALGEIDAGLTPLLGAVDPNITGTGAYKFNVHSDLAPVFYIAGDPAPTNSVVREFERATGKITAVSPITGAKDDLTAAMADPVELKLLHMITDDPQRTPSFVMFGNPNYFFVANNSPTILESSGFAWNHGGIQPEITTTWMGLVGPGVREKGIDSETFASETDYRPTILTLLGLKDDYQHEGRALVEEFHPWAVPDGVTDSSDEFIELARAFEQIDSPLGQLAKDSLIISTAALNGSDAGDVTYTTLEAELANITTTRDALTSQILVLLENAEFKGQKITDHDEKPLTKAADFLLDYVHTLAGSL